MHITKNDCITFLIIFLLAIGVIGLALLHNTSDLKTTLQSNDNSSAILEYNSMKSGRMGATWYFTINISEDCTNFTITPDDIMYVCDSKINFTFNGGRIYSDIDDIIILWKEDNIEITIQNPNFEYGYVNIHSDEYLQYNISIIRG